MVHFIEMVRKYMKEFRIYEMIMYLLFAYFAILWCKLFVISCIGGGFLFFENILMKNFNNLHFLMNYLMIKNGEINNKMTDLYVYLILIVISGGTYKRVF